MTSELGDRLIGDFSGAQLPTNHHLVAVVTGASFNPVVHLHELNLWLSASSTCLPDRPSCIPELYFQNDIEPHAYLPEGAGDCPFWEATFQSKDTVSTVSHQTARSALKEAPSQKMGGPQQPFLYESTPKDARFPASTFDPKAVTRASYVPKPEKPKQDGPLLSFNRHPE